MDAAWRDSWGVRGQRPRPGLTPDWGRLGFAMGFFRPKAFWQGKKPCVQNQPCTSPFLEKSAAFSKIILGKCSRISRKKNRKNSDR
jgi:hypothetical protein